MKELTYDVQSGIHRSAEEEWMPHVAMSPKFFEWHYITLPMTGANGHQYFMFICAFNFSSEIYKQVATEGHPEMIPEGMKIYSTMLHMCDYTTDLFKSGGGPVIVSAYAAFDTENNALTLTNPEIKLYLNFRYRGDEVYIYCRSDVFECELKCTGGSRVLWMQDRPDKPGFIREGAEGDWSFYYSLPKLPYSGWIRYRDESGKEIYTDVTGQGWIDRQWGDFLTKTWEWTSFRFADGDRINGYNFAGGYQVLTYQKENGETSFYTDYKVIQNGYARAFDNTWTSYGWDFELPCKDGYYRLEPLSNKNYIPTPGNTIFEGLCKILDKNGEQVGWAAMETMDVKMMHNAPNEEFNNFPS
ncbi:MAG: carotenoid 1,2-hydratase [Lachnospiraceae bacterium]|nr:carotenoid 1,2-hydratase [Lachnospiraceae bacterium]